MGYKRPPRGESGSSEMLVLDPRSSVRGPPALLCVWSMVAANIPKYLKNSYHSAEAQTRGGGGGGPVDQDNN